MTFLPRRPQIPPRRSNDNHNNEETMVVVTTWRRRHNRDTTEPVFANQTSTAFSMPGWRQCVSFWLDNEKAAKAMLEILTRDDGVRRWMIEIIRMQYPHAVPSNYLRRWNYNFQPNFEEFLEPPKRPVELTSKEHGFVDLFRVLVIHIQDSIPVYKYLVQALLEFLQCSAIDRRGIIDIVMHLYPHITPSNHLRKASERSAMETDVDFTTPTATTTDNDSLASPHQSNGKFGEMTAQRQDRPDGTACTTTMTILTMSMRCFVPASRQYVLVGSQTMTERRHCWKFKCAMTQPAGGWSNSSKEIFTRRAI